MAAAQQTCEEAQPHSPASWYYPSFTFKKMYAAVATFAPATSSSQGSDAASLIHMMQAHPSDCESNLDGRRCESKIPCQASNPSDAAPGIFMLPSTLSVAQLPAKRSPFSCPREGIEAATPGALLPPVTLHPLTASSGEESESDDDHVASWETMPVRRRTTEALARIGIVLENQVHSDDDDDGIASWETMPVRKLSSHALARLEASLKSALKHATNSKGMQPPSASCECICGSTPMLAYP